MSDPAITERQQFWLKHLQAAEEFDGSLDAYARSAGLNPNELYQWKTILVRYPCCSSTMKIRTDQKVARTKSDSEPLSTP
jgi:hypothetical protein